MCISRLNSFLKRKVDKSSRLYYIVAYRRYQQFKTVTSVKHLSIVQLLRKIDLEIKIATIGCVQNVIFKILNMNIIFCTFALFTLKSFIYIYFPKHNHTFSKIIRCIIKPSQIKCKDQNSKVYTYIQHLKNDMVHGVIKMLNNDFISCCL